MSDTGQSKAPNSFLTMITSLLAVIRRYLFSLPGKLLILTIAFVLIAEVLIFVPSAASFRTQWLTEKAEAAHIAALAVDGRDMELEDSLSMELLDSAGAIGVARYYDGVNELILGADIRGELVEADLVNMTMIESLLATCEIFFAPDGRYIAITAAPQTRPDERIRVIIEEAPLRADLIAFSWRIVGLSLLIAIFAGALIYLSLLFMLVRPMRKLARSMTAFQKDPADPNRTIETSRRGDELGDAQRALAAMQADVQSAFKQRERLAALGGAVAKINHDLRNVLSSAQLISDRLAMSSDARVSAMGKRLVRAIDRGMRLCQDTLEYGRAKEREPDMGPLRLRDALDDAAGDAFAAIGSTDWTNDIDDDVQVLADPDHVHRIFLNLFLNAVQAMIDRENRSLAVRASRNGDQIVVYIADTGPGIPDRVHSTLFAPFSVTASKGGSGLGLSIARELARDMGGDVDLHETGPEGSVFAVTLKRYQG